MQRVSTISRLVGAFSNNRKPREEKGRDWVLQVRCHKLTSFFFLLIFIQGVLRAERSTLTTKRTILVIAHR